MANAIEKLPSTLSLSLLVDKDRNRVVFAEADHEFVDILCGFLTLPIGTVVRLLDKESSLGCFDRLYASVEKLEERFFQTPACKAMLLRPRNAAAAHCAALAIPLEDPDSRFYYSCDRRRKNASCAFSSVFGARCRCGQAMEVPFRASDLNGLNRFDGVFVKGLTRFLITDDLCVKTASMTSSLEIFSKLGIMEAYDLEKRTVTLGTGEVLSLLKRSIISQTPLTDVFLREADIISDESADSTLTNIAQARATYRSSPTDSKRIRVKLFLSKESDEVVYAEASEELVNQLFSFISFPLGSALKLLGRHSSIWCMDNLYKSLELLHSSSDYLKSNELSDMLLAPKLAPYFGYSDQLLAVAEISPSTFRFDGIFTREVNPKLVNISDSTGGSFTKGTFMITDQMEVTPLSSISGIHIINKLMVPISSLEEAQGTIGEAEVLDLLRACLISRKVLSDVFSPFIVTLLQKNWHGPLRRKSDDS